MEVALRLELLTESQSQTRENVIKLGAHDIHWKHTGEVCSLLEFQMHSFFLSMDEPLASHFPCKYFYIGINMGPLLGMPVLAVLREIQGFCSWTVLLIQG